MGFASDMNRIMAKIEAREAALASGVGEECLRSIVEGSELTGAPGQPVGEGKLRDSWSRTVTGHEQLIATSSPYAAKEEEGMHGSEPIEQHSTEGGPHSVKLTVAGFGRIVDHVTQRVVEEIP